MYIIWAKLALLTFAGTLNAHMSNGVPKVDITVYYESLCPYSRDFIRNQLVPTYGHLEAILDVQVLPFGWAKWSKVSQPDGTFDVTFQCQHGPQECIGNEIHNCVLESQPIGKSLQLFGCMYNSTNYKQPATAGKECSGPLGLNWTAIDECWSGPLGRGLHLKAGERFQTVTPKPKTVPWIVLNGVHTQQINDRAETDLLGLVCDTYTGTKPDACKK